MKYFIFYIVVLLSSYSCGLKNNLNSKTKVTLNFGYKGNKIESKGFFSTNQTISDNNKISYISIKAINSKTGQVLNVQSKEALSPFLFVLDNNQDVYFSAIIFSVNKDSVRAYVGDSETHELKGEVIRTVIDVTEVLQSSMGNLPGRVYNDLNEPMQGLTVVLTDFETGFQYPRKTSASRGAFTIYDVIIGRKFIISAYDQSGNLGYFEGLISSSNPARIEVIVSNATSLSANFGGAYIFDGVDDYVKIDNLPYIDTETTNSGFTIEAWIKPSETTKINQRIISNLKSTEGGFAILLSDTTIVENASTSKISFVVQENSSSQLVITHPIALVNNIWYHVAGTYIRENELSGTGTLYVNGIKATGILAINLPSVDNVEPLFIGARPVNGSPQSQTFFKGMIDEVKLSSEEIIFASRPKEPPLVTSSTTILYRFDEESSSGQTVVDSSPNMLDGALMPNEFQGPTRSNSDIGFVAETMKGYDSTPPILVSVHLENNDNGTGGCSGLECDGTLTINISDGDGVGFNRTDHMHLNVGLSYNGNGNHDHIHLRKFFG
jgi:hypothetical protein